MKSRIFQILFLGAALMAHAGKEPVKWVVGHQERGEVILQEILAQPWAKDWKGATLKDVKLVKQKPDLDDPTGLSPVWSAIISGPDQRRGHIMWDCWGDSGQLVEFSLDADLKFQSDAAVAIAGVPGLQEFPMKDAEGRLVASGCVPTAAASVVAYWSARKFPQWRGADGKTNTDLARRLRARLKMTLYPDTDGFSDNGMALSGAFPSDLVTALREDAREYEVPVTCDIARFSMAQLKAEVAAGRPVLLSCVVRVAHKPDLSWGHEVAAVGWAKFDGVELVGVSDNFYPTKHPEAIRWIRQEAFSSIISLRPNAEVKIDE